MPIFSDVEFEKSYKAFLETQKEWLKLVANSMFYSDTNANGEESRPLAFTNREAVFKRAQELIHDWQRFADLADEKRRNSDIAITTMVYSPVPSIMVKPERVVVKRYPATSTTLHTREDLMKRYDKQIAKLRKLPFAEGAIMSLEAEKQVFADMPVASRFRSRTPGYSDTKVEVTWPGKSESEFMRYGAHGMLIYGPGLKVGREILVATDEKQEYHSHYDLISPIPCALFPNAKLYWLEDITRAKLIFEQRSVVEQAIQSRRYRFDARVSQKLKRAAETNRTQEVTEQIETKRAEMEKLNELDMHLFELKRDSGDYEVLKMPQLRQKYANEYEKRIGKPFNHVIRRFE